MAIPRLPRVPSGNGTGTAALGQGLLHVGRALGRMAQAQQAKQEQFGRDEAAQAAAQVELDLKTFQADLDLTERDPDQYLKTFQARLQETTTRAGAALTTEEGRAAFQRKMGPALVDLQVAAQRGSNQRYLDRGKATLDTTVDVTTGLIGGIPFGADASFQRHLRDGFDAIVGATPWLGAEEAGKRRRTFRDKAWGAYAQAAIDAGQFRADDPRWAGMDPAQFETITRHAETVKRQREADQEKRDNKAEQMLAVAKQQLVTDLEAEAAAGTLTVEQLEVRREMRHLDPGDYRRLRKDIAEGGVQRASDQSIVSVIGLDVAGLRPRTTEAEINRLHEGHLNGRPGLNLKDAQSLKEKLSTKLRILENEGESDLVRDHNQGEQMIRAALGIRPGLILEALKDDPAGRLYFAGLDELSRRSRLFQKSYGGTEDPLIVAAELVPRLQSAFGQASQPRLNELLGLLRYPTPQALEQAFQAGQIGTSAYALEKQRFLDLNRLRQQIAPMQPGATSKPTEKKPRIP